MIQSLKPVHFISVLALFLLVVTSNADCESVNSDTKASTLSDEAGSPSRRFNEFSNLVRDGKIGRAAAAQNLNALLKELKEDYYHRGGVDFSKSSWVFPLAGYDARSITGGRNKGYIASGYDYFSGNRHGGHPSFDIFIHDRNQDTIDDRLGQPVNVLSLGGGIVVAMEKEWEQGSKLKGGRYIWIYDPANNLLVYYAHNGKLLVELGTVVKPGDLLATVGRSGLNAAKRRSPTHLHLTVLEIKNSKPVPLNVYNDLVHSRKVSKLK